MIFLLIGLLPCWFKVDLIAPYRNSADFLKAFESYDLRIVVSACISTSAPILLDIFRDFVTSRKRLTSCITDIGSSILLFVVITPDLVYLLYICPKNDIRLFIVIHGCRIMAIYGCLLFYIFRVGGDVWKSMYTWSLLLLGLAGFAVQVWAPFTSEKFHFAGDCLIYATIVLFTMKSCQFFGQQYQRWKANQHILKITMNEYSCNVYILMVLLFLYFTMILRFFFGLSGSFIFKMTYIIAQNIMCTTLYVLISTSERGIVIQETIIQVSMLYF